MEGKQLKPNLVSGPVRTQRTRSFWKSALVISAIFSLVPVTEFYQKYVCFVSPHRLPEMIAFISNLLGPRAGTKTETKPKENTVLLGVRHNDYIIPRNCVFAHFFFSLAEVLVQCELVDPRESTPYFEESRCFRRDEYSGIRTIVDVDVQYMEGKDSTCIGRFQVVDMLGPINAAVILLFLKVSRQCTCNCLVSPGKVMGQFDISTGGDAGVNIVVYFISSECWGFTSPLLTQTMLTCRYCEDYASRTFHRECLEKVTFGQLLMESVNKKDESKEYIVCFGSRGKGLAKDMDYTVTGFSRESPDHDLRIRYVSPWIGLLFINSLLLIWICRGLGIMHVLRSLVQDHQMETKRPVAELMFLQIRLLLRSAYFRVANLIDFSHNRSLCYNALQNDDLSSVHLRIHCERAFQIGSRSNRQMPKKSPLRFGWIGIVCGLIYKSGQCSYGCTDFGRDLSDYAIPPSSTARPNPCINDIRGKLSFYPCLKYNSTVDTFEVTCPFSWTSIEDCLVLRKHERFEGNGQAINLTGISNFEGLFQIADKDSEGPSSLENAPVINDVHVIGGETSPKGGFIIQAFQKHFIVKSCSSSGVIQGQICPPCLGGGGICGQECSGDILITHCWSTGEIRGIFAGGIAGQLLGIDGDENNQVTISHCYSNGGISGLCSGGICGCKAGNKGIVTIEQCYSVGEISGQWSGGITGGTVARNNGRVFINNCFSRGSITGTFSTGGICGAWMGSLNGTVILTNVYSSGQVVYGGTGGLMGSISKGAKLINITMSVHSGGDMIGWNSHSKALIEEKNSANLSDITGTVYCYNGHGEQPECWDTETIWQAVGNDFPILQGLVPPPPSSTPSPTPSASLSPTRTLTPTISSTSAVTNTETMTPFHTPSPTVTATRTSSQTRAETHSPTKTSSCTPSESVIIVVPTFSNSLSPTACCNHGGSSHLQAVWKRTDMIAGLCFTGLLSLLGICIGYKRFRNKRAQAAKSQCRCSEAELYAIRLGVSERQTAEKEEDSNLLNASEFISENPLAPIHCIHHGEDTVMQNTGTISSSDGDENTINLPFTLVDAKNMKTCHLSQVKVLSAKQPDFRRIDKNKSTSNTEPRMQIARISDLDTSQMSPIDRAMIKLRKWKAKILAEPPPVVAVSLPEGVPVDNDNLGKKNTTNHKRNHSTKLAWQLEFAANRRENDRSNVNTEISRYAKNRRQGHLRKKEFKAIPPSFQ